MNYYVLPKLPYGFDALEPLMDTKTMRVHYEGHHKTYVDKLNAALADYPQYRKPVEELLTMLPSLPTDLQKAVRNNGGGHANHALFWTLLSPESEEKPTGEFSRNLNDAFGGFHSFKEKFTKVALDHFSSGWAWLCVDHHGALRIFSTKDHESPLSERLTPLLTLDLWEHAYYLKHQNRRPEFVEGFWKLVNWREVSQRWAEFQSTGETHREWRFAS